ncbi:DUF4097 family beta strand repeat-containing protein [Sinomonas sp. P10A9]|uniref:DUF4097 family beta strand repeat-containing protein n=1 Tax=Sinomonas puerhi TaxID=3238584 RepID=A0AB39L0G7_9MICC
MEPETWSVTGPQTIDIESVGSLRAGIVDGRLDVIVRDGPGARIEVSEVKGEPLTVSLIDGRLEVRHREEGPQGWLKSLLNTVGGSSMNSAIVSIAVPRGTIIEIATVTGEGFVAGAGPTTRLNTVSGSLLADDTDGEMHLNTVSGDIIARAHSGVLTAKTVSGEITASGALTDVRATSVSGGLSFDLSGFCRTLAVSTMSGDLTVRVPHDTGVDLSASMVSGHVVVDDDRLRTSGGKVSATLGPADRRTAVRAKSVSGDISVVHAPAPAQQPEGEHS